MLSSEPGGDTGALSGLLSLLVLLGLNMSIIHATLYVLLEAKGPLHLVHQLAKP